MTTSNDVLERIGLISVNLDSVIGRLDEMIEQAEGGNLAEIYTGARDNLTVALGRVRAAHDTLDPEGSY